MVVFLPRVFDRSKVQLQDQLDRLLSMKTENLRQAMWNKGMFGIVDTKRKVLVTPHRWDATPFWRINLLKTPKICNSLAWSCMIQIFDVCFQADRSRIGATCSGRTFPLRCPRCQEEGALFTASFPWKRSQMRRGSLKRRLVFIVLMMFLLNCMKLPWINNMI